MQTQFNNLFTLFNCIELCPLCNKRLELIITLRSLLSWQLQKQKLLIFTQNNTFSIDTLDNSVCNNYNSYINEDLKLLISLQCKKYHFFYSGYCNIIKEKLHIENIVLEKIHFVRILKDSTHFVVNNNFNNLSSTVYITRNYSTKELKLPIISFDLSSKKLIDNKLKIIQLLG